MRPIEILAPAGGRPQLEAAVRAGADAVYLGAKNFNARKSAQNFGENDLAEAVSFCHARGVLVHVTLNTLLKDSERDAFIEAVREVAQSGADAVIVQDLAAAKLVKECCPDIALHASTQMAVHNIAGAKQLESMGFQRIVLARELTLSEIRAIADATHLEIETFVHGALCMSASGCCYLSAMIGGRSGNRGRCAQPCRLDFKAKNRDYALSLKDMSVLQHVRDLEAAGVCSLKIEGRMKRPEYVAAATHAARCARDGEPYDTELLRDVFSRSGFTDGYLTGHRTLDMFGIRTKDDVENAAKALKKTGELIRTERARVGVDMAVTLAADKSTLTLTDGENTLTVTGPAAETALSRPADEAYVRRAMEKTGGTPFFLRNLQVTVGDGLILPAGALNTLRREGLEQLLALRERPAPRAFSLPADSCAEKRAAPANPALRLRVQKVSQLKQVDASLLESIVLPLGELLAHADALPLAKAQCIAQLPALVYPTQEAALAKQLAQLKEAGFTKALCGNIGTVYAAKEAGLSVVGDFGLNITNGIAAAEYAALGVEEATLSFELSLAEAREVAAPIPLGLAAYGALPLMRLRCCPLQGPKGCGDCPGHGVLTDRTGARFPVGCHGARSFSTLYNSVPLYIPERDLSGVSFLNLMCLDESPAAVAEVVRAYAMRTKTADFARTGGLYFRGVE